MFFWSSASRCCAAIESSLSHIALAHPPTLSSFFFVKADNAVRQKATDSLLNAETVKLYSGEEFEAATFMEKIVNFQKYDWTSIASLGLLNVGQARLSRCPWPAP